MLDLLTVGSKFTQPACRAVAAAIDRYLPAPDLSSKPADHCPSVPATFHCQRDRRTDGRTLDRFTTLTAYYADRVIILLIHSYRHNNLMVKHLFFTIMDR